MVYRFFPQIMQNRQRSVMKGVGRSKEVIRVMNKRSAAATALLAKLLAMLYWADFNCLNDSCVFVSFCFFDWNELPCSSISSSF